MLDRAIPASPPGLALARPVTRSWDQDDARAFVETLFAKHHGEIYAYLIRMLRDPDRAADLAQDAFVKAYKNYDTLEKDENARAWLYQIAHRVALDDIRQGANAPVSAHGTRLNGRDFQGSISGAAVKKPDYRLGAGNVVNF